MTFKDGSNNLTCSGGNPAVLSAGTATCGTTFSTEGIHVLAAQYSGDGTFVGSTGTANVFAQNHAIDSGTNTYCNTGAISNNGLSGSGFSTQLPIRL